MAWYWPLAVQESAVADEWVDEFLGRWWINAHLPFFVLHDQSFDQMMGYFENTNDGYFEITFVRSYDTANKKIKNTWVAGRARQRMCMV